LPLSKVHNLTYKLPTTYANKDFLVTFLTTREWCAFFLEFRASMSNSEKWPHEWGRKVVS
jgi:hypothetical protein